MRWRPIGALSGLFLTTFLLAINGFGRLPLLSKVSTSGHAPSFAHLGQASRRARPAAQAPLRENDLIKLLQSQTPRAQVQQRARSAGIDFVLTTDVEQQLRQAGADDSLLETLSQIQPRGLVWGPARHVATAAAHGLVDVSNLVTENGKHYLAFTGDDKHVYVASDATGAWKIYEIYGTTDVGNGANQWYVALVVRAGTVYVPFVTWTGSASIVGVSYNAGLQGPWAHAAIFSTDSSNLHDPFATLQGDTLLVSFDTPGPPPKSADDVFVASIPLASLPTGGAPSNAPLAAHITNVSREDDVQGGPDDDFAEIVPQAGGLAIAWQRALKTLVFAQGQADAQRGSTWPSSPQLLNTATDQAEQSLQLAAAGQTVIIARFIGSPNQNNGPTCCDVWATTNATGGWSTQIIGGTNMALQKPGVAVSACGPSVAFPQALTGNSERLAVATFDGARWVHQSLATNGVQPRLAATPDGLDLAYKSASDDIFLQHARCFPPPAPLHP
jgi:hypothetical protein